MPARTKAARRHSAWPLQDHHACFRLRLSGLVAQKAYDKPMNTITFEQWWKNVSRHTLEGDVVVMDNRRAIGTRVEQLIKAVGAELLYLPPYSPDMNPIEKAYSKLKASCAKSPSAPLLADERTRSLRRNLQTAECVNYLRPADMIRIDRKPL